MLVSIAKSYDTKGKMGILHTHYWKQLFVHSCKHLCNSNLLLNHLAFALHLACLFPSHSTFCGYFWKLLCTQIYTVLSNPGMYVTSTNLLLDGNSEGLNAVESSSILLWWMALGEFSSHIFCYQQVSVELADLPLC